MGVITKISYTEHVSVVTFENMPNGIETLSILFETAAKAGINVDMISQSASKGDTGTVSFSVIDSSVRELLQVVNNLAKENDMGKPLVTIGNVKFSLYGEDMPNNIGIAADIFTQFAKLRSTVLLITTSAVDISVIVQSSDSEKTYAILKEIYLGEIPVVQDEDKRKIWKF